MNECNITFFQVQDLVNPSTPISAFVERIERIKEHYGEEGVKTFLTEFLREFHTANNN